MTAPLTFTRPRMEGHRAKLDPIPLTRRRIADAPPPRPHPWVQS